MGGIIISEKLIGQFVDLKEADSSDAGFILNLRCNEVKSKYLHKTENNIEKQIDYLKKYKEKTDEWYFIILNKQGEKIGTNRIYNIQDDCFTTGSWIMTDGCTGEEVFESDYLVRMYGFETLGFNKTRLDVKKGNKKVISYHKMLGAIVYAEDEESVYLEIPKDVYLEKSKKWLTLYSKSKNWK